MRNKDIHAKVGAAPIDEKIRENSLRWFGHVQRRPTNAPVRRGEFINIGQIKRTKGRLKKIWM